MPQMIVGVMITSLILIVVASSIRAIMLHSASLTNYADMTAQGKETLTFFRDDVQVATDIIVQDSNKLLLETSLNPTLKSELVEYIYDPYVQTLVRTITTTDYTTNPVIKTETVFLLMDGIKTFTLNYYTLVGDVTTKAIETKKIKLQANLERGVGGATLVDQDIAAQVIMRNRKMSN